MPIIKARTGRIDTVRYVSRLQKPNRDALLAYASFIGDTPDYVLNALISATLAKDRDFLSWQAARVSTPSAEAPPEDGTTPPAGRSASTR
jgi:hypothetical protein